MAMKFGHSTGPAKMLGAQSGQPVPATNVQAHRSGRKINVIDVLGPRRIGLSPAKTSGVPMLFAGLIAHHLLDDVKDRHGILLDGHAIFGEQHIETQRGQQQHNAAKLTDGRQP